MRLFYIRKKTRPGSRTVLRVERNQKSGIRIIRKKKPTLLARIRKSLQR